MFAKSRLTHPTSVSIEHMRRINGYNALHYVWDRLVSERINIRETLTTAVTPIARSWHLFFPGIKKKKAQNKTHPFVGITCSHYSHILDEIVRWSMLHIWIQMHVRIMETSVGNLSCRAAAGTWLRRSPLLTLIGLFIKAGGAPVQCKVSTSKVTLQLRPHLQPDKPIVTANKTILILQVATGLCILLIRIKHLSLFRPTVCQC